MERTVRIGRTDICVVSGDQQRCAPEMIRVAAVVQANGAIDEHRSRHAAREALRQACARTSRSFGVTLDCAFALRASAKIIAQEIFRLLREDKADIEKIVLRADTQEAHEALEKDALGYLDYIENKLKSPFLTVDAIIELAGGIVVIQRSNPPFGWALPGGFVDYGESLEDAAIREAREETGLDIKLIQQLHTYSDPRRDPRFHTVGTVFVASAQGLPQAGDDAAAVKVISIEESERMDFAFDHKKILEDYRQYKRNSAGFVKVDKS